MSAESNDPTPKPGRLLPDEIAKEYIERLTQTFRPPFHKYLDHQLPIPPEVGTACYLEGIEIKSDFSNLRLSSGIPVFAFFEHSPEEVYETTLGGMMNFLSVRQPWEDYDICIFDASFSWCFGISHENRMTFARPCK